MSYGREWRQRAIAETKLFWSAKRIAVAVISPPLAGVLWAIFKPWAGWGALMQVVAISILGLFAQWAVVFFLCLIEAPSQLDSEKTIAHEKEIEVLAASRQSAEFALAGKTTEAQRLQWALAQKHPHDKRKEAEIEKALATLNTQEREALAWLLNAGETRRGKLQARGLNADALFENGEFPPLLAYRSERPGNGTVEMDRFYYVNPNMVDALRNVLYPPRPVAPPRV